MPKYSLLLLFFCTTLCVAQKQPNPTLDDRYLEDQFYTGLAYNFLGDKIDGVVQRNFSYNFQLGYLRDIPFNKKRNFGVAMGLGYATNSYYTNLLATQTADGITYQIPDEVAFNRGKFEAHAIELPFEVRWRTSNATTYTFWRIYAGAKLEYNFSRRSTYVFDDSKNAFANDQIKRSTYGLTLNVGYNTFNIHLYYGLNQLLDQDATVNGQYISLRPIRIGVIFYIL